MAECVVDGLEVIDIQQHYGKSVAATCGTRFGLLQPVQKQTAVRQPGQSIVVGDVLQSPHDFHAFADIAAGGYIMGNVAIVIMEWPNDLVLIK